MTQEDIKDEKAEYRDTIATVDEHGKRVWIYPKMPKGWFYERRKWLSYILLAALFGMPFIKIGGQPFLLFNILERKFVLFGLQFAPQDFHLAVLAMLTMVIFIALFTVVYGRIFCGWICPQTIFMEMVFRRIEYWIEGDANAQKRLDKAPWTGDKIRKKALKQTIFVLISILIAHTFLSYIIGYEQVFEIMTSNPLNNLGGFAAMVAFTGAFYVVFTSIREQVCTTICPYGRMQGVLTDPNTILISYDYVRGEPRGKLSRKHKKATNPVQNIQEAVGMAATDTEPLVAEKPLNVQGDCIDCKLCVQVCPTGIDIRDGIQLECVNCTACIDACDEVMVKIGKPKKLIRYDSEANIAGGQTKIFTPRVIAYSGLLSVLLLVNVFLLGSRSEVETLLLRTPGMLYQRVDDQTISNLYNYEIINKQPKEYPIEFRIVGDEGALRLVGEPPVVAPNEIRKGALFIDFKTADMDSDKEEIIIEVWSGEELLETISTNFMGPMK